MTGRRDSGSVKKSTNIDGPLHLLIVVEFDPCKPALGDGEYPEVAWHQVGRVRGVDEIPPLHIEP